MGESVISLLLPMMAVAGNAIIMLIHGNSILEGCYYTGSHRSMCSNPF